MNRRAKEYIEASILEAKRLGWRFVKLQHSSKSGRIVYAKNEATRFVFIPMTPSDNRGIRNIECTTRKVLQDKRG